MKTTRKVILTWTDEDEADEEDRARACMALGLRPSEYDAMTPRELNAWMKVYEDMNKKA